MFAEKPHSSPPLPWDKVSPRGGSLYQAVKGAHVVLKSLNLLKHSLLTILVLLSSLQIFHQSAIAASPIVTTLEPQSAQFKERITHSENDPPGMVRVNGHLVHASRFLARFKPSEDLKSPQQVAADQDFGIQKRYQHTSDLVTLSLGTIRADQGTPTSPGTRYENELKALRNSGQFLYVEPDYLLTATATPSDLAFTDGTLWGLSNSGQSGGVTGADVNAVPAWDITTGSSQVIVAVIDSGLRTTHQDLAANLWINVDEIPDNGLDDDGNGFIDDRHGIDSVNGSGTPSDNTSHGTHVAGTIGAVANGGGPHVGVTWDVQLMGLKFLDTNSGFTSNAITCIEYAIANGADIINASWGGNGASSGLRDAISAAEQAGILFVAAAGNDASNNDVTPHYPSNFTVPNIISVAALDRSDALASFSNFGATSVDLGAPGVQILSSHAQSDTSYAFLSGTSMATPHVAGVAALVKSQFPNISVTELKARLLDSTTSVAALTGRSLTEGRVNAHEALTITGDGNLEFQLALSQIPLIGGRDVSVFATVTDLVPVTGATVAASFESIGTDLSTAATPVTLSDDGISPDPTANDGQYSGTLTAPIGVTSTILRVTAEATGKNPGVVTATVAVIPPPQNDLFANRIQLPVGSTSASGSNVASSQEGGEPLNPPTVLGQGGSTVWWSWIAPASGVASINTIGSDFDTTLAIYRGTSLPQLELIASNDDDGSTTASQTKFVASAGIEYQIQDDGYNAQQGNIVLNYPEVVASSGHAQIIAPPSTSTTSVGSNAVLDIEVSGETPRNIQWFKDGSPISGATTRSLQLNDLSITDAGQYSAEVSNASGNEFSRSVPLLVEPAGSAPSNDNFANAINLPGSEGSAIGFTQGATGESGEPNHAGVSSPLSSVWWRWQAPSSGALRIRSFGSDFDTTLAAYSGSSVSALSLLSSNNNAQNSAIFRQSELSMLVQAGEFYAIAVAGSNGATGSVRLDYRHTRFEEDSLNNGSFETGDLTAWTLTDFSSPQTAAAAAIGTTLVSPLLPFSTIHPSKGNFAFVHGFESQVPSTLKLSQQTTLAAPNLSLIVDYRAGWSFSTSAPPTSPRTFSVIVEPTGGGAPLATQTILSTGLTSLPNTELQTAIIPLNNAAAEAVTIRFEWNVPEASKGPAFFEMDLIRLIQGCESIDGLTYSVASSPTNTNIGDHFHSAPSIDSTGIAEVGRKQLEEVRGHSEIDLRNKPLASQATLHLSVLEAGGRFRGINDFPFQGMIDIERYIPSLHHTADVSEYKTTSQQVLATLQTSALSVTSPLEIDITDSVNQQILEGQASFGVRLRANPLQGQNTGAWTFGDFRLVLDCRVPFTDPNLEQGIRNALGKPTGVITTEDLASLTNLSLPSASISNLQGLEFAINLISLDLRGNLITDISPLTNLTALQDTPSAGLQIENNLIEIGPSSAQRQLIEALNQRPGLTVTFRPQQIIDTDADNLDDRFEQRIIDHNLGDAFITLADVSPLADFDADTANNRSEFLRFTDPTDLNSFVAAGDLDKDGTLTVLDLVRLQSHLTDTISLAPDLLPIADTNLDGAIDATDHEALIESIIQ